MKIIEIYIILFFIYAFLGWLIEISQNIIVNKKFVNRGFLIGPYCPIYGCGGILITILLGKFKYDPILVGIYGMLICSLLEYITSYLMEKMFKARWWDYSNFKFNINGRICLETTIPFGLLGYFITYVSNPFFINLIDKIPFIILSIITIFLLIVFLVDNVISFNIINNVKVTGKKFFDNTEEITESVKKILQSKSILYKRLINAFPDMRMIIKRKIKIFKKQKKSD